MRFSRLLQTAFLSVSLLGLFAYVACIGTPMAQAQADLGSISGVVTDVTGAVIPNAEVKLTNVATGAVRVSVTNSKGEYAISQLLPAEYSVSFSSPGFNAASHNVQVTVGSTNTVNVKLAVAGGSTRLLSQPTILPACTLKSPRLLRSSRPTRFSASRHSIATPTASSHSLETFLPIQPRLLAA